MPGIYGRIEPPRSFRRLWTRRGDSASGNSPASGVSSNRAGSTYSCRSRTARLSAARRSSRVQSRAAYSAETNTTTAAAVTAQIARSVMTRARRRGMPVQCRGCEVVGWQGWELLSRPAIRITTSWRTPGATGSASIPASRPAADALGPAGHAEMVVIFEGRTWPAPWRGPGRRTEQERVDGCRGLVSGWPGR